MSCCCFSLVGEVEDNIKSELSGAGSLISTYLLFGAPLHTLIHAVLCYYHYIHIHYTVHYKTIRADHTL